VSEKITVDLDLEENSKYRVAFELAHNIARIEGKHTSGDRKYWLELYQRCRDVVVDGHTAAYALQRQD
jgi:hypothetical protein